MRREIKKSIKNLILKGFPPLIPRICQEMEAGLAWKMRILEGKRARSAGNSIGSADGWKRDNFPSFSPKFIPWELKFRWENPPGKGLGSFYSHSMAGEPKFWEFIPKKSFGIEGNPTLGQEKKKKRGKKSNIKEKNNKNIQK